jgi:hypothetical protein
MDFTNLTLVEVNEIFSKDHSYAVMDAIIARDKDIQESIDALLEMIESEIFGDLAVPCTTKDSFVQIVNDHGDIHNTVTSALEMIKQLFLTSLQEEYVDKLNVLTQLIHS